jgi:hypothetical protein
MKVVVIPAAVMLVGLAQAVLAVPAGKEPGKNLAALEEKMLGKWKGQSGCAGNFVFRANGTYELTGYGPAAFEMAGAWTIRWDALPPTLVLTCRTSDVEEVVGTSTEFKLIQLDDSNLAIERTKESGTRYGRVKD